MASLRNPRPGSPWPALWALVLGFFMILVDSTIVSVATPALKDQLDTSYSAVIWVTSAYLLAYAVPLLVTGRLGDRLGPKKVYLTGLAVFTLASLWCGMTNTIEWLIIARVFQGFGASMMSPQTMSVITRTFSPTTRGQAMSLWGATAGIAMLTGPILGGVLVDHAGWQWIFLVNIPVGIVALVLAWMWVPDLETHSHTFDGVGVILSVIAVSLVIFGLQEGQEYEWGQIYGPISVPALIAAGVLVFGIFIWWQTKTRREPLVPLTLFRERNFSLSNIGVTLVSFTMTSFPFPFMLWAQSARGWSPTQSGLVMIPMALLAILLAPIVGRLVDRGIARRLAIFGFATTTAGLLLMVAVIYLGGDHLAMMGAITIFGLGSGFLWAPLSTSATYNLPMAQAGAGSGVYNATRQLGAVLGSAAIAAAISARMAVHLPADTVDAAESTGLVLPPHLLEPFSDAMAEALFLPIAACIVGLFLVMFLEDRKASAPAKARAPQEE